jgi:hypothetical protein
MAEIKRPVFFSGENPGMTLCVPGTERVVAVASYWYCTDSPWGVGHVLVLWLADEATSSRKSGSIFTDSINLAQVLVNNLTQHFPEFRDVPIETLAYVDAHCEHRVEGRRVAPFWCTFPPSPLQTGRATHRCIRLSNIAISQD